MTKTSARLTLGFFVLQEAEQIAISAYTLGISALTLPIELNPLAHEHQEQQFAEAIAPIFATLEELRKQLPSYIPQSSTTSKEICRTFFQEGGKFIRPALFLLSCRLLGYEGEHLLPMAGVCELVHTASLLHDDVIDNSPKRRNKPTVNHLWGDESAVLVGDLFYATASELMARTEKLEIVRRYAEAIRTMSEGELLQLENIRHFDIALETYFSILTAKTAALIGVICRSAGILANRGEEQKNALEHFGLNLGLAFQLVDDALDYRADADDLGKQLLTDLREGKLTLPLLLLKEKATSQELNEVAAIIDQDLIGNVQAAYIVGLVTTYQTSEATLQRASIYTEQAVQSLRLAFAESPARLHLEQLAFSLLSRGY